jgi:hypothetical protein
MYPEYADPVEPTDIFISVCDDCGKAGEYLPECECEDASGYTEKWWLRCQYCREVFATDDAYSEHSCSF